MPSSVIMTNSQCNRLCHESWSRPEESKEHCFTRQGLPEVGQGRSIEVGECNPGHSWVQVVCHRIDHITYYTQGIPNLDIQCTNRGIKGAS